MIAARIGQPIDAEMIYGSALARADSFAASVPKSSKS
jgi:hypothetical protein